MATTYDAILTYDLSTTSDNVSTAVKDSMRKKGYADRYTREKKEWHLPNTTLWKANITSKTAVEDLKSCVDDYNKSNRTTHKVERAVAVPFDNWYTITEVPYTSKHPAPIKNG